MVQEQLNRASSWLQTYLPGGVVPVAAVPSVGSCTRDGAVLTCPLGTLAVGTTEEIIVVTIDLLPTQPVGTVRNTVAVDSSSHDPDPSNNVDDAQTEVDRPGGSLPPPATATSPLRPNRRRRCDPVLAGVNEVDDRETFERLLETIATAAWYGDGRTTTLEEARSLCPDDLKARFDSFAREEGRFVRLLAAAYFRESRERRGSRNAFEFTHKSFGEYLTARRLVREIGDLHENVSNLRGRYSEDDALRDWCKLTGPKAMEHGSFAFPAGRDCASG